MATGERESIDGAKRPSTRTARPGQAETNQQSVPPHLRCRRVSFSHAVAGMAVAIALGCAAIAFETPSGLSSRNATLQRRLEVQGARIVHLRVEAASAQRQLAMMSAQLLGRVSVNRA
jgi:hypothetical protein